jgi:hypothetical protein
MNSGIAWVLILVALVLGFGSGFAFRSFISYRRRKRSRRYSIDPATLPHFTLEPPRSNQHMDEKIARRANR